MKPITSQKMLISFAATAALAISLSSCRRDNEMTDDTIPDTTTSPDTTIIAPDTTPGTTTIPESTTRETMRSETRTEQQSTPDTTVEPRIDPNSGTVPAPGTGTALPDELEPE